MLKLLLILYQHLRIKSLSNKLITLALQSFSSSLITSVSVIKENLSSLSYLILYFLLLLLS